MYWHTYSCVLSVLMCSTHMGHVTVNCYAHLFLVSKIFSIWKWYLQRWGKQIFWDIWKWNLQRRGKQIFWDKFYWKMAWSCGGGFYNILHFLIWLMFFVSSYWFYNIFGLKPSSAEYFRLTYLLAPINKKTRIFL